jgi:activator of HSP90 ATPase
VWFDAYNIHVVERRYAADLIKPTKGSAAGGGGASTSKAKIGVKLSETVKVEAKPKAVTAPKASYKTIKLTEDFKCSGEDLFKALITEDLVRAYTASDSKVDSKVGGEFSLFGGNVSGVFKEIVPYTKITQAWRMKAWPSGHFSDVTLEIAEKKGTAVLTLTQSGVPDGEVDSIKGGWRSNQWARMKGILGFGSGIMSGF